MKIWERSHIPITIPRDAILRRLKYNVRNTVVTGSQMSEVDKAITRAAALCEPCGRFVICPVQTDGNNVALHGIGSIQSKNLSRLMHKSVSCVVMAATVGVKIVDSIQKLSQEGQLAEAVIQDAVASEMTEATIAFLHKNLAKEQRPRGLTTTQRYAPGYGDLDLSTQCLVFDTLRLSEIGLTLSPQHMLIPEKSTSCFIGLEEIT